MAEGWRHGPIGVGAALALALGVSEVRAHGLNLFATAEGNAIQGRAYFSGGGAAGGVSLLVVDADGAIRTRATTAADGRFVLAVDRPQAYRLIAETADGHRAEFVIRAEDWPAPPRAPASAGGTAASSPSPTDDKPPASLPPGTAPAAGADEPTNDDHRRALIERAVETALARQLAPLREELATFRAETRWRDVLGGLGYILGLAGLAAFLLARRRRPRRQRADGP